MIGNIPRTKLIKSDHFRVDLGTWVIQNSESRRVRLDGSKTRLPKEIDVANEITAQAVDESRSERACKFLIPLFPQNVADPHEFAICKSRLQLALRKGSPAKGARSMNADGCEFNLPIDGRRIRSALSALRTPTARRMLRGCRRGNQVLIFLSEANLPLSTGPAQVNPNNLASFGYEEATIAFSTAKH